VVAAISLAFLGGWTTPASALVLDWDAIAAADLWPDGSTNNSFDVNGDAINDITIGMIPQDQATWAADLETGTPTPTVNQSLNGGLSQNALNLSANLKTHSNVWIHISFTGAQPGASDVSFTIFDIDITTNADIIETIVGRALDGTFVFATITNVGADVNYTGNGFQQVLRGTTAVPNSSSSGNATISFGSTIITDVYFDFSNSSGTHQFQNIAIGDITFTPVPEINPAMAAAASCVGAVVFTILLQRRARRARQTVR
jgi:hypothetical protein